MKHLIWQDGRFAWPFFTAVVFLTVSMLLADYAWRVTVAPIGTFLIYFALLEIAGAAIIFGLYSLLRSRT